ncbi:MAG: ABC transporter ATP-binding protein [Thermoplasmata archaeon]
MVGTGAERDRTVPLDVQDLSVRYGDRWAVRQLSFRVNPGEIYGLLGSNGAGKSSTIKAVVGLVRPASGVVRVFGQSPETEGVATKRSIGYVPETPYLFDALSPREFFEFVASVRKLPSLETTARALNYAKAFQVDAEYERPIGVISSGVRQKVLLIAALLHEPPLLILDEPFNNLDPRAVRLLKDLLHRYAREARRGVLLSTHTLELAEQLCDRVGILDQGVLRGEGTLAGLRAELASSDATLESIFLRLTAEEDGVRDALELLRGP